MSVNCNKIVQFDDDTLEAKSSLGRSASAAVHAALSDCYKAIETLEANRSATGAETVYLQSARTKLETAAEALRGMREILSKGEPSKAVIAWLGVLDYDRLYEAGTKRSLIPSSTEQWNRLTTLMRTLDHLAVTNCLIADVEEVQRRIDFVVDDVRSASDSELFTPGKTERVLALETALHSFSIFAQMVAYVNAIEPMDKTWTRQVDIGDLVMEN